jgi:Flp pilus assembly protein TadD
VPRRPIIGLAYARAGARSAQSTCSTAARAARGHIPRTRQNLALAYALGGDWQSARTIAAQDVSPADLADRMTQWALLSSQDGQ